MISLRFLFLCVLFFPCCVTASSPTTFEQAKRASKQVYADYRHTFYCNCPINWSGFSGKADLVACNYKIRKDAQRANRVEWEHVMSAHSFGQQRPCWRQGGRKNCVATDRIFRQMEADMYNLVPSVGEVNGDRSNFRFGILPSTPYQHGQCPVKIDFQQRVIEPRTEIRGQIARIYFYMHDRYNLSMSRQQEQLFVAWNKQYPVSDWEKLRNQRIARIMQHTNPYVTGEKEWVIGDRNQKDELSKNAASKTLEQEKINSQLAEVDNELPIRGNKNSKVYHLPIGCPSYDAMKNSNIVKFNSEREARESGYRKAGNCL